MKQTLRAVFATLTIALLFSNAFGHNRFTVYITYDTAKRNLQINDLYHIASHDTIDWVIKDAMITSFYLFRKSGPDIFTPEPANTYVTSLTLVTGTGATPFGGTWKYGLHWKDTKRRPHTFDPKIAIDPTIPISDFILFLLLMLTTITSITYRKKWKNMKAQNENKLPQ